MYFDGYNFEQKAYQIMNISYVANRIVYVEDEVKRTSYYLTDDGYNLLWEHWRWREQHES